MNRVDFLRKCEDYIDTLEATADEPMTEKRWREWIKKECNWHDKNFTDEQIGWIIEELESKGLVKTGIVENDYGVEIDFEVATYLMEDDIREALHNELVPCTDQEFFDAYVKVYKEKYGEPWEFSKKNTVY